MSAEFEPVKILLRDWAITRGAVPFKANEAFESIKDIDDIQDVYRAIKELYKDERVLARRKGKGPGYEYVWGIFATPDFELESVEKKPEPANGDGSTIANALGLGVKEPATADPAQEIPIPESIRKRQAKPEQPQSFSSEAIADALIRRLKPVLQAQFANAALESTDALAGPGGRITLRIEHLELTVESLP